MLVNAGKRSLFFSMGLKDFSTAGVPKTEQATGIGRMIHQEIWKKTWKVENCAVFNLAFSESSELILVAFGKCLLTGHAPVFDAYASDTVAAYYRHDTTNYWFWSEDPPEDIKYDIADRDLHSV